MALRNTVGIMIGRMASVVVSLRSATVALVLKRRCTRGGRSSDRYLVHSTWTTSMVRGCWPCWAMARKFSCDHPFASRALPSLNASSILTHLGACWRRHPGRSSYSRM
eukprot:567418-Amphidinium_carterae.3